MREKAFHVNITVPVNLFVMLERYRAENNFTTSQAICNLLADKLGVNISEYKFNRKHKPEQMDSSLLPLIDGRITNKPYPTSMQELLADLVLSDMHYQTIIYSLQNHKCWTKEGDKKGYDYSDIPETHRETVIINDIEKIKNLRRVYGVKI